LSGLDEKDLCSVRLSSKTLKKLADHDTIWKPLTKQMYPDISLDGFNTWRDVFVLYASMYTFDAARKTVGLVLSEYDTCVASDMRPYNTEEWGQDAAQRRDLGNWRAVASKTAVKPKTNYCEFIIEEYNEQAQSNSWKIIVGIVPESFTFAPERWIGIGGGFGFIAQNGRKVGPHETAVGLPYGWPYHLGDRIAVYIDFTFKPGTILFFKNGQCQGIAYQENMEKQKYYFATCLARDGFKVRMFPGSSERKAKARLDCQRLVTNNISMAPRLDPHLHEDEAVWRRENMLDEEETE